MLTDASTIPAVARLAPDDERARLQPLRRLLWLYLLLWVTKAR